MRNDPRFSSPFRHLDQGGGGKPLSPLQRVLAVLVTIAVFSVALMFSVVVFAVVVTVGAVAWAWVWWKTRALRKELRTRAQAARPGQAPGSAGGGVVIEGEVIREVVIEEDSPPRK